MGICPYALHSVSVRAEPTLGHLRYLLTDVPPQPNSPPGTVLGTGHDPLREGGGLLLNGLFLKGPLGPDQCWRGARLEPRITELVKGQRQ